MYYLTRCVNLFLPSFSVRKFGKKNAAVRPRMKTSNDTLQTPAALFVPNPYVLFTRSERKST